MKQLTIVAVAVLVIVAVAAGAAVVLLPSGGGTLSIGITDNPVQNVSHIYLTISNIQVQGAGNASTSYSSSSTKFDLLSLVNVTKMLGSAKITAGNYTMIRFDVTSAVATIAGANVTLTVPSGEIKVPLHFKIKSGSTTTVVLDITVDMTNVSASGNLRPVVTVKSISGPS